MSVCLETYVAEMKGPLGHEILVGYIFIILYFY